MKFAPTYLTRNRHGTFYFRMVIPATLRPLVNGKREIRRSLKTDSERLALKRARQHAVRFDSIFDRASRMTEHNNYEPSQEDFDVFEELCGRTSNGAGLWSSAASQPQAIKQPLSDSEIEERQRRHCIAELLTGRHDRPIPNAQKTLAQQLLELSRPYQPTELRTALPKLRDALALRDIAPAAAIAASAPTPASGLKPEASEWTLYQVWEEELRQEHELKDTKSGGPVNNEGTRKDYDRKARCATILTNHKPVGSLTKDDWRQAYRNACKLKRGATASVEAGRLTALEELKTSDREELTYTETMNGLITALKRQHRFSRENDLTSLPVDAISYTKLERRPDEETESAKPFTDDDLNKIFGGYTYKGKLPPRLRVVYPFHYWLPLLGYFTGARANELAQLDVDDISLQLLNSERGKSKELVWCISFREDPPGTSERKRIKTGEDRIVPLHPRILELGFLAYVDEQRRSGQKKLYGDGLSYAEPEEGAENNKEGWLKNAGRHFNSIPSSGEKKLGYFWRVGVHTEAEDGKTLYSFRKTLTTALNDAIRDGKSIAERTIQTIIGHAPSIVMHKHYDQPATPRQMLTAIEHMPIPQAIRDLQGYNTDFALRLGEKLDGSIKGWRNGKGRASKARKRIV
ncbi:site-specific integrase [Stutzerimonas sp. VN223-3]|uniref:DUF6538 domain-containing protein n=1 Tax=Stutzerimonas sp. VN223-3 TaxID=3384601 RepID=UPI0038B6A3FE